MSSTTAPTDNTSNPYGGRGPEILGVSWALIGLTTVLLSLRVILQLTGSRDAIRGLQALLWAWAAWVLATMSVAFLTVSVYYGLGNHFAVVKAAGTLTLVDKWMWVADAMIGLAIGVGKFAIVTFYIAIQGPTYKWRQRSILFLAATNLANNIITIFLIFFQCTPPESLWDQSVPGTCPLISANYYWATASGAWNAATDVVLALYPIGIVYHLQMPRKVKIGLCVLMGMGLFTAVCSTIKTYEVRHVKTSTDPTYLVSPLILWGISEQWVILITASIPPLWPIIKRIGEQAAALSRLSSEHSLSSVFSQLTLRRPRAPRSDSASADELHLVQVADSKANRLGHKYSEDAGQISGDSWSKITVQQDITSHSEVGQGSSVIAIAERAT